MILVTHNSADFNVISHLMLENWFEEKRRQLGIIRLLQVFIFLIIDIFRGISYLIIMIQRIYSDLSDFLSPGKVLILFGARQVGKTTLIKKFLTKQTCRWRLESGDNILLHEILSSLEFPKIISFVEGLDLLVIDEAQRIPNIGMALKILCDQVPDLQILVTGSSSFELAGQVGEPLTGRKKTLTLFPVSVLELSKEQSAYELSSSLENFLLFGMYPAVLSVKTTTEKRQVLEELVGSYLLKDLLELERIKSSKILLDLLRLLAYQVGSEVSAHELGQKLGLDGKTVARYLDLLEKGFVLFSLRGYSNNLRKEITRKGKYYFFDTGLRNCLISNFNPLDRRNDIGALWENFLMIERLKTRMYSGIYGNPFFWRTWDKKEIDLVEERDGQLWAYEFKWKNLEVTAPKDFMAAYPNSVFCIVHKENWAPFLLTNK